MTDATELWDEVLLRYDADGLTTLTNIRDRSATGLDPVVGVQAATSTLNFWPSYAQVEYDGTDEAHIEAAVLGVIAVLWRRGGASSEIEKVKWEEVFGPDGVITKVKRTGPRGRAAPVTNSGVTQKAEQASNGATLRPWADRSSLPSGIMPSDRAVDSGY